MTGKRGPKLVWKETRKDPLPAGAVLREAAELSHCAGTGSVDNVIVHGDNLRGLSALEGRLAGRVQCIYIDPPYNTGGYFEYYQDHAAHSDWLTMMRSRLRYMHKMLSDSGFLCCHIDESEAHYLKVLLDELFGRSNYVATLYVQVRYPHKTLKQDMDFHKQVEQVLVYRKSVAARPHRIAAPHSYTKYRYRIEEQAPGEVLELGGRRVTLFRKGDYAIREESPHIELFKEIWATGTILDGNSSGRFFRDYLTGRLESDGLGALYKVEGIGDDGLGYRYFTGPRRAGATKGRYYQGMPLDKRSGACVRGPVDTVIDMAAAFGNCRHEGAVDFRSGKKPECLLQFILRHFSREGDIVLDAFAGSGTTGAVAHKMRRRWVLMECGDHCRTHIAARLRRVVDGDDPTGVTESEGWQGGGGFRFLELVSD